MFVLLIIQERSCTDATTTKTLTLSTRATDAINSEQFGFR